MPSLQNLIEEISELKVDLKEIKIRPDIYDSFISDAEDLTEEEG